jgi:hypothetical protein
MEAVWVDKLEIGTSATSATPPVWTYNRLCKGVTGMTFTENEQNQQNFFLCGEGFADNDVTGAAPELVITGKRIVGDAAQDYVAGLQFKLGDERRTSVKVTTGGKVITCDCTIGNITSFGGNTLDQNAFGCTIRFNGKPTVTDAA